MYYLEAFISFTLLHDTICASTLTGDPLTFDLWKGLIMTKSKINLIVDALMLLCVTAITGIGLLMKFVLVPGQDRWPIYGRNVELFFWGLDRHQWGTVHLAVGLVFIALLILHIILHWAMILVIYRCFIRNRIVRRVIVVVLILLMVLLLVFPWLIKPQVIERGRGREQNRQGFRRRISQTESQQVLASQIITDPLCRIINTSKLKSEPNWEV